MVHAAIAHAQPRRRARPHDARAARRSRCVGDLLATQAKAHGVAALLVDGAVRDVEELVELGLPIWARWIRVRGAGKDVPGHDRRAGDRRRRADRGRRHRSCSTPTAPRSSRTSGSTRCSRPRASARRRSASSARSCRRASSPTTSTTCARAWTEMTRPRPHPPRRAPHPEPEQSLALLRRRARHGDRVARRPVGLPARLRRLPALLAQADRGRPPRPRAHGAPRPQRRGAGAPGRGDRGDRPRDRLDRRRPRPRPRLPLQRPRRPRRSSSTTRPSATRRRRTSSPSLRNQPQRYTARGAAVKRLDHVNLLAADVAACRAFATDVLGYRHYEGIVLDDGSEAGAWLSLTIAAHELIYVADARGAGGRLHHLAFWVDTREECLRAADLFLDNASTIEAAPSKHAIAPGLLPLRLRARRQPHRGHHRRLLRLRPRPEPVHLDRGRARARPGLGRQDRRELPLLRHAADRRGPRVRAGGRRRRALAVSPEQVVQAGDGGWRPRAECRSAMVVGPEPAVKGCGAFSA